MSHADTLTHIDPRRKRGVQCIRITILVFLKGDLMYEMEIGVGEARFTLWAFGPHETYVPGVDSWALAPLLNGSGKFSSAQRNALCDRIDEILQAMHVEQAYAPNVHPPTARIVSGSALLFQTMLHKSIVHWNYLAADGIFIERGEAFVICPAGCPIIIGAGGEQAACAHGSRATLTYPGWVRGSGNREHESITFALVEAFGKRGVRPESLSARMVLQIPGEAFGHELNHEQYGDANRKLAEYLTTWPGSADVRENTLFVHLDKLFVEQARQAGIADATATHSLAQFPDLTDTRKGDPSARNLVVIRRDL